MWMVEVHFDHGDDIVKTYKVYTTREQAQAKIDEHRMDECCYLVELWQHAGCQHAIG